MTGTRITKKPEIRRQEIMDAALALFSELGYEETSVAHIVARVQIQKGTFYHYFQSKEALLDALVEQSMDAIMDRLEARLAQPSGTMKSRIRASLEEVLNVTRDFSFVFQHMHHSQNSLMKQKMHAVLAARLGQTILAQIQLGNASGDFKVRFPEATADLLTGGFSFLLEKSVAAQGSLDWVDLRPKLEDLAERLLGVPEGWLKGRPRKPR